MIMSKKSEEWYKALIQSVPDIIYELDVKGRFTFISDSIKQLGYVPEELLGKHFREIVHPDDFKNVSSEIVLPKYVKKITGDAGSPKLFDERRTGKRMTKNCGLRLLFKKQKNTSTNQHYAEVHSSGKWDKLITEKNKKFLGSIGIVRDVTKRKKAEKALQEKRKFNKALFDYNPIETIVVDRKGRVIDFNLAKKNSGDKLPNIGCVMYRDYAGKHKIDMYAELMKSIRTGKAKEFPEQKYGNEFLSITMSPFPKGAIITSIDVTEHKERREKGSKRAEELGKAYEQLQASKDALIRSEKLAFTGRIAANIAHEIRNPLTNVAMAVQQLTKAIKPEGPPAKHMDIIKRNTERINYLITELLNCARPPKLNIRPCSIHKVLEDILEFNKAKISSKRIKIIKRFISNSFIIKIDKEQIERSLSNLLVNAVEAMSKGGKLTIITDVDGDSFVVKIQDTGKGIPEEDIIRIFDPFFSSKSGGVGLGLAICYGIIVSHGGTIEVESKPKKGSTFMVSLPVK